MVKILIIVFFLLNIACVRNFNYMSNDIQADMSKEEVIKIMGNSEEKKIINETSILVYYMHNSIFDLFISKNFPYIGFYPLNRTGKEFWIIFKNDKVVASGLAGNFGNKINYKF